MRNKKIKLVIIIYDGMLTNMLFRVLRKYIGEVINFDLEGLRRGFEVNIL